MQLGKGGTDRLSNLPKATQLVSDRASDFGSRTLSLSGDGWTAPWEGQAVFSPDILIAILREKYNLAHVRNERRGLRSIKTCVQGPTASKQMKRCSTPELTGFYLTCRSFQRPPSHFAQGIVPGQQVAISSWLWLTPHSQAQKASPIWGVEE